MDDDTVSLNARGGAVVIVFAEGIGWIVAGDDHRLAESLTVYVTASADEGGEDAGARTIVLRFLWLGTKISDV